tara:strand:- start:1682 stop:2062 length:381 start_codon:yes stop_codon:yes gene_type:complete
MFHRRPRRFRRRQNGRSHQSHGNGNVQARIRSGSFISNQSRNNFRSTQSAEKLLEKYNNLAKEALSSGDKTSCENYLQHADHFTRIIEDKNRNKVQSKNDITTKSETDSKSLPDSEMLEKKGILDN